MTWITYRGILARIEKLRRFEKGEGASVHEILEEKLKAFP